MTLTTIHIKTDTKTRDAAKKVAEEFGFTLSALVNAMLKQVGRSKRIQLDLYDETPSQWMIDGLRQSDADETAGRVISFKTADDAVSYVQSLIDHDKHQNK